MWLLSGFHNRAPTACEGKEHQLHAPAPPLTEAINPNGSKCQSLTKKAGVFPGLSVLPEAGDQKVILA